MYKKYVFSGHESFPCRMLWPIKGYDYIVDGNPANTLNQSEIKLRKLSGQK